MTDKSCNNCGWDFKGTCTTALPKVGCVHWSEREVEAREQLAQYVHYCVREGVKPYSEIRSSVKRAYLGHADRILEIVEESK